VLEKENTLDSREGKKKRAKKSTGGTENTSSYGGGWIKKEWHAGFGDLEIE